MLKGEQPIINGDGEQTRDFVYVGDVAEANISAISNHYPDKVFNIGTGIETSVNHIFRHLKGLINQSFLEKHGDAKKGEQKRSVIDCAKAKEILQWEPQTSLENGLRKTCEYFRILNS